MRHEPSLTWFEAAHWWVKLWDGTVLFCYCCGQEVVRGRVAFCSRFEGLSTILLPKEWWWPAPWHPVHIMEDQELAILSLEVE